MTENRKSMTREGLRQIARDKVHQKVEAHLRGCRVCGEFYFGAGTLWPLDGEPTECPFCGEIEMISVGRLTLKEDAIACPTVSQPKIKWEIREYGYTTWALRDALEDGWEPFAVMESSKGHEVWVRRQVPV